MNKKDTAVTGYDTDLRFYATRYQQGGRTVYSLDLSVAQIVNLVPAPDPSRTQPGNRRIQPVHAAEFGTYLREKTDWVSPAIVLRSTGKFDFNLIESIAGAEFGVVALPMLSVGDLHILDGQHRILGMHMAVRAITEELEIERARLAVARKGGDDPNLVGQHQTQIKLLTAQRRRFEKERLSIQLFIEDSQLSYQQMFYDIADNALGITASVRARFDSRKIVNRALLDVMDHPMLKGRVELERDRLGRSNPNLLSARHIADIVRILHVGLDGRISRRLESELVEGDLIERSKEFFTILGESFHQLGQVQDGAILPAELRNHSMLGSPVTIRVLAGVYYELKNRGFDRDAIVHYFELLDPYFAEQATTFLVEQVGEEVFFPGALAPSSRRQDLKQLVQKMVLWATTSPAWLGS